MVLSVLVCLAKKLLEYFIRPIIRLLSFLLDRKVDDELVFVVVGVGMCGGGVSNEAGIAAASAHCTPFSSIEGDGGVQAAAQRSCRN